MTNLIQSLPSPSAYSGGITHTWMGETWLVDVEALAVMAAMISSNSPSRQGARTEFLTPGRGFAMAAEFCKGFVKSVDSPDVFRSRGLSSREGVARGCPRPPHHVLA